MDSLNNSVNASMMKSNILFSFYSESISKKHTLIKMLKKKKIKAKHLLQSGGRYHCLIQI